MPTGDEEPRRKLSPRARAGIGAGGVALLALFFFGVSKRATAEESPPYLPPSADVVLEKLPQGKGSPESRAEDQMRRELAQSPRNLRLAVRLAKKDVELARAHSDPRYLGYAQAALAPWYKLDAPPHEVVVLRATIRQSNHDFDGALQDLDIAVSQRWDDPQVWITKAVILTVRAEYEPARDACEKVRGLGQELAATVCVAAIDAVTGHAEKGYETLAAKISPSSNSDAGAGEDRESAQNRQTASEREWALSTLGEIAIRKGDYVTAEKHFQEVLAQDPGDAYTLGAYTDLLLDLQRPAEVIPLLRDKTVNDAVLLRLAIAERAIHSPDAPSHIKMLAARYDASRARGDVVHRREQARFALLCEDRPDRALALATDNWGVQREVADARILLEAAKATGDKKAAEPALSWLEKNHVEDPTLRALAKDLH